MSALHNHRFSWRRNLAGAWIALFAIQFGSGFSTPYIALYLNRDFNIRDPSQLALLTGIAAGVTGISAALVGPLWGVVGDRYGRRAMIIRGLAGGGVMIAAGGFAPDVTILVLTRIAIGISAGVSAASTAIVAEGTPPSRLGWALGIAASARAIGLAAGPIFGGVLASAVALRVVFGSGGLLVLLALLPVILLVREPTPTDNRMRGGSIWQSIRGATTGTANSIITLSVCIGLAFFAAAGTQQLIVLRLLTLHPTFAALTTGVTFTVFGISTALAATQYSRFTRTVSFRGMASMSAGLLATAVACAAVAPTVELLVLCAATSGLGFGALTPTLNTMLGLEAPSRIRATVFGLSGSFSSLGNGAGPLAGGAVAAVLGLRWGLFALASMALVAGLLVLVRGREPTASPPEPRPA